MNLKKAEGEPAMTNEVYKTTVDSANGRELDGDVRLLKSSDKR